MVKISKGTNRCLITLGVMMTITTLCSRTLSTQKRTAWESKVTDLKQTRQVLTRWTCLDEVLGGVFLASYSSAAFGYHWKRSGWQLTARAPSVVWFVGRFIELRLWFYFFSWVSWAPECKYDLTSLYHLFRLVQSPSVYLSGIIE